MHSEPAGFLRAVLLPIRFVESTIGIQILLTPGT